MFTGIITDMGELINIQRGENIQKVKHLSIAQKWGDTRMRIACHYDVNTIDVGASISHNGACMTVVEKGQMTTHESDYLGWYSFDVSDESLDKTTMKDWRVGHQVNLERAIRANDELGGHLVSGHVDDVGIVLDIESVSGSRRLRLSAPEDLMAAIAPKGSIVVDGVSLTINKVDADWFEVNIIPHTAEITTLGLLDKGDIVNLEIDLIARYVTHYMNNMVTK